jgi:DNA-binding CsgD family transcriptional regulator
MKDITFLFYFFAFSIGMVALGLSGLIYLQQRLTTLRYYLMLQASFLTMLFIHGIRVYYGFNTKAFTVHTHFVFTVFINLAEISLINSILLLLHSLFEKKVAFATKAIMIAFSLLYVLSLSIDFFLQNQGPSDIRNLIVCLVAFSSTVMATIMLQRVEDHKLAVVLRTGLLLNYSFIPMLIFQVANSYTKWIPMTVPFPFIIYNMLIGILTILFAAKYFFKPKEKPSGEVVSSFIKTYYISKREKEIIQMLVEGRANKYIAEKLFISESTVKNHIYNIFQKTESKNRVELVNKALGL